METLTAIPNQSAVGTKPRINPYRYITFQYLVEVPRCNCVFASGRDPDTGKVKLFLFNYNKTIYVRNGIRGTWIELENKEDYDTVRVVLARALQEHCIPCYTTEYLRDLQ